jgi:Polyketide cyclase / dehydrase and lipid transport
MITAYYSTVLDHPVNTVWSLVRDFNNYPAYIEGVTESVIEDGRRGDEVGAVRRFCYRGNWIRQRLGGHSDKQRLLSYVGIDPLKFPAGLAAETPSPAVYEGALHLLRIVDGERTFIEWSVALDTVPEQADSWRTLLMSWIPEWIDSLRRTLELAGDAADQRLTPAATSIARARAR